MIIYKVKDMKKLDVIKIESEKEIEKEELKTNKKYIISVASINTTQ